MHCAAIKVAEIKLDIAKGCFDSTLEKYNPVPVIPKVPPISVINKPDNSSIFLNDLVKYFNDWSKNIRNVDVDNAVDYLYVRRLLEKLIMV